MTGPKANNYSSPSFADENTTSNLVIPSRLCTTQSFPPFSLLSVNFVGIIESWNSSSGNDLHFQMSFRVDRFAFEVHLSLNRFLPGVLLLISALVSHANMLPVLLRLYAPRVPLFQPNCRKGNGGVSLCCVDLVSQALSRDNKQE